MCGPSRDASSKAVSFCAQRGILLWIFVVPPSAPQERESSLRSAFPEALPAETGFSAPQATLSLPLQPLERLPNLRVFRMLGEKAAKDVDGLLLLASGLIHLRQVQIRLVKASSDAHTFDELCRRLFALSRAQQE